MGRPHEWPRAQELRRTAEQVARQDARREGGSRRYWLRRFAVEVAASLLAFGGLAVLVWWQFEGLDHLEPWLVALLEEPQPQQVAICTDVGWIVGVCDAATWSGLPWLANCETYLAAYRNRCGGAFREQFANADLPPQPAPLLPVP